MDHVRQTSDPLSTGATSVSNQDGRPTTPSNLPNIPLSSSSTSSQGYFSTPAPQPQQYTTATSSSPYAPGSASGVYISLESPYSFEQWPTYSTPNTSHHDAFHNLASSPSPPLEFFNQPVFAPSGKNKYFDYYNPMNNANSSTESFASHFHSHSQQTSEESALYGDLPADPRDSSSFQSFAAPYQPSISSTNEARTQLQSQQPNASGLSSSQILPGKDSFTPYSFQHGPLQGNWDGTYPNSSSGNLPAYGSAAHLGVTVPGQRATEQRTSSQFQQQQQQRRVGQTYNQGNESFQPAFATSLPSVLNAPRTSSSDREQHNAMYSTREDSSFSSSASESVNSGTLIKQAKHDDGRPKRPLNAFMIYSRARRAELQKEQPGLKIKEISSALADEWRNLDKPEKDNYLEMARVVKETFHKTHPNYVFSRRANGTKGKKAALKSTTTPAAKTSLKRVASNGIYSSNGKKRDSDDSPFSPEGSISSASSTSSFIFPRQQSPLNPSVFRRPSTGLSQSSSGQSSRFTPFGGTHSATNSRHSTPAVINSYNSLSDRWPSVLADQFNADYMAREPSTSSSSSYPSMHVADFPSASSFNSSSYTGTFPQSLPALQQNLPSTAATRVSQSASPIYQTRLIPTQEVGSSSSAPDRSLPLSLQPESFGTTAAGNTSVRQVHPSGTAFYGSSESSGFLNHYRAHLAASSSSPNNTGYAGTYPHPGASQAFTASNGLPSPYQAQWQHGTVFSNGLLPSMQSYPQNTLYGYGSVPSAMTFPALGETSVQPTTPLRLPSLSQLDMSPLYCAQADPATNAEDQRLDLSNTSGTPSPTLQKST